MLTIIIIILVLGFLLGGSRFLDGLLSLAFGALLGAAIIVVIIIFVVVKLIGG